MQSSLCSFRRRKVSTTMVKEETSVPTKQQLRIVALRYAIPMIGFGFMDNLVMIQAGDAIDQTFGVALGISTMTAAGFGQCFSDVAGNMSGGMVDAAVAKLNLPHHGLSETQLDMKVTRIWRTMGACVGVVTGCLLGMSCLLFMDTDAADRARRAKELESIFKHGELYDFFVVTLCVCIKQSTLQLELIIVNKYINNIQYM